MCTIVTTQEVRMKDGKVPVVVYIDADESVNVVKNVEKVKKPNYFMIGNGTMNKHKIYGIDLLRELANSSKAAQFLLLMIKDGINYENGYNPVVKIVGETKYQQNQITEGYKELVAKDLVRRIKKSHYMINPFALIPPVDYEEAVKTWEQAGSKIKKKDNE